MAAERAESQERRRTMPELPEIASRAGEMKRALKGKTIADIEILQPKCLNVSPKKFRKVLKGARFEDVDYHGKWIFARTTKGYLLLNLGMGGDMLLCDRKSLPEKYQAVFDFDDGRSLSFRFWWFGYIHYAADDKLDKHKMTAKLGPNAVDVSKGEFRTMLRGRRGSVKSFLLNQERIAGIGNAYVHDILFLAGLHPNRKIDTLSDEEIDGLWQGIQDGLVPSMKKGGAFYERSLRGKRGRFVFDDILVGYREGQPCPVCGAKIVKIKTGSTSTFICPKCQSLKLGRGRAKAEKKRVARPKKRASAKKTKGAAKPKRVRAKRKAGKAKRAAKKKATKKPTRAAKSKKAVKRKAAKPKKTRRRETKKTSTERRRERKL
jgi:formamidopyrimidine-DNA glycosylase